MRATRLRRDEALNSRDAVARVIYTKMFEWVITAINGSLSKGSGVTSPDTFIGLLDIFGFEVMDKNGFEQLCINYANEKLQLFFNEHMLQNEQRAYHDEGIEWVYVDFTDNTSVPEPQTLKPAQQAPNSKPQTQRQVLGTLEGRPQGLLPTLDDQCLFATATDASFLQVLSKAHAASMDVTFPKIRQAAFVVRHSAGSVEYDISGNGRTNPEVFFSLRRQAMKDDDVEEGDEG